MSYVCDKVHAILPSLPSGFGESGGGQHCAWFQLSAVVAGGEAPTTCGTRGWRGGRPRPSHSSSSLTLLSL